MKNQADKIKLYILKNVAKYPEDISKRTMKKFEISRTTVNRHINNLVKDNLLIKTGSTRNIIYQLPDATKQEFKFEITSNLDEYQIYSIYFLDYMKKLGSSLEDIAFYVITEMINNVRDHSQGKLLTISWQKNSKSQVILIKDDGIGIFKKLQRFCKLQDIREAILHLVKGKLTTDPANHTGEGIFFSSKVVDEFSISANGIKFIQNNIEQDWFILSTANHKSSKGTEIELIFNNSPSKTLIETFKSFQLDDSLDFNITEIKIELSKLGQEKYISRSQAKRVLQGLEKFKKIILDFTNVRIVGQGFADEVFRVYLNNNTDKIIQYINANDDVEYMLKRSIHNASR